MEISDFQDPEDIRAKMPDVERFVRAKRRELEEWESFADQLARFAGIDRPRPPQRKAKGKKASAVDLVVEVLAHMPKPQNAAQVADLLDNRFKRDTVSWALWQAEKDKQIQRVSQGWYASLTYKPTQDELAAQNGAKGGDQA